MQPFIERYSDKLDEIVNDPATSKRFPRSRRLTNLYSAERDIWERLMRASGQESLIGRTTATINIVADQEYYALPANFRQFLEFYKLDDNNNIEKRLRSTPPYSEDCGVLILDGQRGMIIQPTPDLAETWTLVYQRGPTLLHYARVKEVKDSGKVIVGEAPASDAGELARLDGYYTGSLLRIYEASNGAAPQTREVTSYVGSSNTFRLRHALSPIPKDAWYEICPAVPEWFDDIYAYRVGIGVLQHRSRLAEKQGLITDYREMLTACKSYYESQVADRPPMRTRVADSTEPDPWDVSL